MADFNAALIGAISGVTITSAGWFVNAFLNDRAKRREVSLKYIQRQIEELYGPLFALIHRSIVIYEIARKKLPLEDDGSIGHSKFNGEQSRIWQFFVEEYFLPLNKEMSLLIQNKLDLVDSIELPNSFLQFMNHEAHYAVLHQLWKTHNVNSIGVEGGSWPQEFTHVVHTTLNNLRIKYNNIVEKGGGWSKRQ